MNEWRMGYLSVERAQPSTPSRSERRAQWLGNSARFLWGCGLVLILVLSQGCATKGDFRKLEERLLDAARKDAARPDPFERIAALASELDAVKNEQRRLQGQLEVAQKTADRALADSAKARESLAAEQAAGSVRAVAAEGGALAADGAGTGEGDDAGPPDPDNLSGPEASGSSEVLAYQEALSAWRSRDPEVCIDRFRKFLQTYPASPYADDAAYWMADCHFKQGDYRVAVLRFNDVVRVYPTGNKAPDALYRQGASLLKLGPGFYDAAKTVFKQVLKEYPDSTRAKEAREQLEAIGSG